MSNLDDIVKSAQGGQLVDNLSERLGLASWQAEVAVLALAPALSAALTRAAESPETLRPVVAAIGEPRHKAAFASAESAHSPESVESGDAIVAHLFGSAAAAGEVSQLAARDSGLRADVLQRLLPVLVSIVAGGLSSTLAQRGLDEAFTQASQSAASPTEPAPSPAHHAAGGLAGAVAGLLAALFGKRPAPPAPVEPAAVEPAPAPAASADALEQALAQIRQIFTTGAPVADERRADLDALLGRIFGPPRG